MVWHKGGWVHRGSRWWRVQSHAEWKAWRDDETAGHGVSHLQLGRRESELEVRPSCKTSVAAPVTHSYPASTPPQKKTSGDKVFKQMSL